MNAFTERRIFHFSPKWRQKLFFWYGGMRSSNGLPVKQTIDYNDDTDNELHDADDEGLYG